MKPIISQKLINVLKNKIFNVISLNLFNNIEFLLNNLLNNNTPNQYFNVIFKAQQTARDIVKSIVISTFEELDNEFKESTYRKSRYYINKSNVPRSLITIVGEITFYRTYYISKHSNKKFFYIKFIFLLALHISIKLFPYHIFPLFLHVCINFPNQKRIFLYLLHQKIFYIFHHLFRINDVLFLFLV